MSGGSPQPARMVRMARPKSYAQISEATPAALKSEQVQVIAQPALGNQGQLQQQRIHAKSSVQIRPEAVVKMAADMETVVGLLREQILDAGEEQRIVDIVRQWRDTDRRLGPGSGTPHLDRFLLMTKMRAYTRSTGRSGFMDQMAMVYEDLFRELEDERLEQFQAIASASQMYSGPPGEHDAPENFWATMGTKEAVGVWGILKGMGTSAAGMVDAGAWGVTRQMKAAGVDVADPASAATWLAEQYDISGDAMFGRKEWSEGEELFLGMSAAEFATHGGEGVWMLVMMGKGGGGAKWAQAVEKAIGLSSNMMAIELSAKEIVDLLDAQYKANGKLDAGLLMQNPAFHQAILRLVANAFGAVAGDKQKAQRISALLEGAQLSPIVGQLVEIATSDASVADKKKRAGPVLMELIKQVIATAGAVRQTKQPDAGKGNEGPDEAAMSKSKVSSTPVEEPLQLKPPAKLKTKPADSPVVKPPTQAEMPPVMATPAKLDTPEKSKLFPGNSRSEKSPELPPETPLIKASARESVTEALGTEMVGDKAIDLAITYPKPVAVPETQTVESPLRAKAETGNTDKLIETKVDSGREPELLKDIPLPPELQRQLDLGLTGGQIIGAVPKLSRRLDIPISGPELPAASVIDFVARERSAMAVSSRVQPEAPAMMELPGRMSGDMVQMMGGNSVGGAEKSNRVITVDLPVRDVDTPVPIAATPTSDTVELPRMGRMGLFDPAPISEVAMPVDRRPDIAPDEGMAAFPKSHVAEKTMGKGVKGGGTDEPAADVSEPLPIEAKVPDQIDPQKLQPQEAKQEALPEKQPEQAPVKQATPDSPVAAVDAASVEKNQLLEYWKEKLKRARKQANKTRYQEFIDVLEGKVKPVEFTLAQDERNELLRYWSEKLKRAKSEKNRARYQEYIDVINGKKRPGWKQSEEEVEYFYNQIGGKKQQVYRNGRKGSWVKDEKEGFWRPESNSVVPDISLSSANLEIKNYLISNKKQLIEKLKNQIARRKTHLPYDSRQQGIILDFRGQNVSAAELQVLILKIHEATSVPVENIQVVRWGE